MYFDFDTGAVVVDAAVEEAYSRTDKSYHTHKMADEKTAENHVVVRKMVVGKYYAVVVVAVVAAVFAVVSDVAVVVSDAAGVASAAVEGDSFGLELI